MVFLAALGLLVLGGCSDDSAGTSSSNDTASADGQDGSGGVDVDVSGQDTSAGDDTSGGTDTTASIDTFIQDDTAVGSDIVGPQGCNGCHGDSTTMAPPHDTQGNTDTTFQGVGAHRSHLRPTTWHRPVVCTDCHVVPSTIGEATHMDGLPAELTFGAVPTADGASPDYVADGGCSNVYCHGSTLDLGGSNHDPNWTSVDGSQVFCGSCHAAGNSVDALGGRHALHLREGVRCGDCHANIAAGTNDEFVDPTLHVDGILQANDLDLGSVTFDGSTCTGPCHGEGHNAQVW